MKMMMRKVFCCAVLGGAVLTLSNVANAQATDQDKQFLAMAAQGDQNEIAMSKLAVDKASDPDVKAFAEKMVKEHAEMTDSMKPYAEKWGLTAPAGPDADHQKEIDKLNGLNGKDFDKEYIDDMVSDHAKAYKAFVKESNDTTLPDFKASVIAGKKRVAAHKNMAWALKKKL